VYNCAPAGGKTTQQIRAAYAIMQELYASNLDSYRCRSFPDFKARLKHDLGAGLESVTAAVREGDTYRLREFPLAEWERIRGAVCVGRNSAGEPMVRGRLKSLADYTRAELRDYIDKLLSYCYRVGLDTPKFREIVRGMEARG
jgi:hypothetical protein